MKVRAKPLKGGEGSRLAAVVDVAAFSALKVAKQYGPGGINFNSKRGELVVSVEMSYRFQHGLQLKFEPAATGA